MGLFNANDFLHQSKILSNTCNLKCDLSISDISVLKLLLLICPIEMQVIFRSYVRLFC